MGQPTRPRRTASARVGFACLAALAFFAGCRGSAHTAASRGTAAKLSLRVEAGPIGGPTRPRPTMATSIPSTTATPTRTATPTVPATSESPLRVELWGDSISAQAASYFSFYIGLSGKAVAREHTFPGSALCDWFPDIRRELDPANLTGYHPQVAVLQFSGDSFTPCMRDSRGKLYSGQALVDKYAADSAAVIAIFARAKVPVYFASTPLSRSQSVLYANLTPLDVMFSKLPARFPNAGIARYVDAADPLEWHGRFTYTLPCAAWDTCTGRWPDGTKTVVVRQSDGTHFCPVKETVAPDGSRSCPVVMPGAVRFALAVARPILRDFHQ